MVYHVFKLCIILTPVWLFYLKVASRRLQPPVQILHGVFLRHTLTLSRCLGALRRLYVQKTRQSDYDALVLSLSRRSFTAGADDHPPVLCDIRIHRG